MVRSWARWGGIADSRAMLSIDLHGQEMRGDVTIVFIQSTVSMLDFETI